MSAASARTKQGRSTKTKPAPATATSTQSEAHWKMAPVTKQYRDELCDTIAKALEAYRKLPPSKFTLMQRDTLSYAAAFLPYYLKNPGPK